MVPIERGTFVGSVDLTNRPRDIEFQTTHFREICGIQISLYLLNVGHLKVLQFHCPYVRNFEIIP
jgi:hypothetical protein